jgi:transglutaminase-like putative cysteine protease
MPDTLRLKISHTTTYSYDAGVPYALQQVRLTPKNDATQSVLDWTITVTGGQPQAAFDDNHRNRVNLISLTPGTRTVTLSSEGLVDKRDTAGVVGQQGGFMPLWMFRRTTPLTGAGPACRRLIAGLPPGPDLSRLHALMGAIHTAVAYTPGVSHVGWTGEEALAAGQGVCQDMAHAFVACARAIDIPARYVSGYLMMSDRVEQDATHAWAEAHVPDLGWIAFDPVHNLCPSLRHVRVATGLDYAEAAPITGTRFGTGAERLTVTVAVEQVQQ